VWSVLSSRLNEIVERVNSLYELLSSMNETLEKLVDRVEALADSVDAARLQVEALRVELNTLRERLEGAVIRQGATLSIEDLESRAKEFFSSLGSELSRLRALVELHHYLLANMFMVQLATVMAEAYGGDYGVVAGFVEDLWLLAADRGDKIEVIVVALSSRDVEKASIMLEKLRKVMGKYTSKPVEARIMGVKPGSSLAPVWLSVLSPSGRS